MFTAPILSAAVFAVLASATFLAAADAPPIPQSFPVDRYQRIWTKSPFTVASVIAPTQTNTAQFTDSMTLVGLTILNGEPLVTVRDTTRDAAAGQSMLISRQASADGLSVSTFKTDLDPSKVEVTLKKGDQTGTLKFNVESFAAGPTAPQDMAQSPNNGGNIPPPTMPANIQPPNRNVQMTQPGAAMRRRRAIPLPGADRRNRAVPTLPPGIRPPGTIPPPNLR